MRNNIHTLSRRFRTITTAQCGQVASRTSNRLPNQQATIQSIFISSTATGLLNGRRHTIGINIQRWDYGLFPTMARHRVDITLTAALRDAYRFYRAIVPNSITMIIIMAFRRVSVRRSRTRHTTLPHTTSRLSIRHTLRRTPVNRSNRTIINHSRLRHFLNNTRVNFGSSTVTRLVGRCPTGRASPRGRRHGSSTNLGHVNMPILRGHIPKQYHKRRRQVNLRLSMTMRPRHIVSRQVSRHITHIHRQRILLRGHTLNRQHAGLQLRG